MLHHLVFNIRPTDFANLGDWWPKRKTHTQLAFVGTPSPFRGDILFQRPQSIKMLNTKWDIVSAQ